MKCVRCGRNSFKRGHLYCSCALPVWAGSKKKEKNMERGKFEKELAELLNQHSMENASDSPDFLLAEYLVGCLRTFNIAVASRENWYGRAVGDWKDKNVGKACLAPLDGKEEV